MFIFAFPVTFPFNKRLSYRDPKKIVMDYKYIEQLLERYWQGETSLQEETILRSFFSQQDIPAALQQYQPLFVYEQQKDEPLGDDFDARMMAMIGEEPAAKEVKLPATVKARQATLTQRLMPLFRAAAVVAIILTLGGALQAPWDSTWNDPSDYAKNLQQADTVATVSPIQAENIGDAAADSTNVMTTVQSKD